MTVPLMTHSLFFALRQKGRKLLRYALLGIIAAFGVSLQADTARADASFDLSNHSGKVVLVDFWASWCGPCRQSFPWMNDMHSKYEDDGLVIVAVNVDNDLAEANRFLSDYPASFQVHFDEDKSLAREYEIVAMPERIPDRTRWAGSGAAPGLQGPEAR